MLHPRIKVRDRPVVGEHNGQLQLCVPLVATSGESYRMRDARQHRQEAPTNH